MDDYEDNDEYEDSYESKSYEGRAPNLEAAFEEAWKVAQASGAPAGLYTVQIAIETENPIRSYVVVITPSG
jgi:hypothetical protein